MSHELTCGSGLPEWQITASVGVDDDTTGARVGSEKRSDMPPTCRATHAFIVRPADGPVLMFELIKADVSDRERLRRQQGNVIAAVLRWLQNGTTGHGAARRSGSVTM